MYKAQLTYGSDNLAELNAIITGPLVAQTLAGKVAIAGHRRDGNIDNIVTAREDGAERSASVRAQLLWLPRDHLKILFGGDYFRDTSDSRAGLLDATFHPVLFPTLEYGPDVTDSAFRPQASNTIVGVSATLDWATTAGTMTSISGYRSVRPDITYSALGDPYTELLAAQTVRDRQFSEELHFASNGGRRFSYLVGLFYLHLNRLDDTLYTANPVPGTVLSFLYPPGAQSSHNQEVLTESRAVFGEGTYKFLDTLDVTVGARYSSERRSGHSEITPTESSGPYEHTWSSFTPKLTLAYRPADGLLTYATVAKGFQSGGFDASAGTSEALRTPFSPETVINYELGVKAFALDRRLSANVAVFLADYKDLQRTAFDSNPAVNAYRTTNAGKARVKGVELDTSYLPARGLKLAATYAYTDARYRQYLALQDNGTMIDYSGNTLPQTPKQQVHFSTEISVPWAAAGGMLLAGADYTYRSQIQFVDANDTPQLILDKTRYDGIVNLHAGWQSSPGNVWVNVFAKNVTDKRALVSFPDFTPYFTTFAEFSNPANHIYLTRYSPRRLIGISLTLQY
jgi:iron complex outermembrane receptor protein